MRAAVLRCSLALLALLPLAPRGSSADAAATLQRAPAVDADGVRRGAAVFLNNCLNCHGARFVRGDDLAALGLEPTALGQLLERAGIADPAQPLAPRLGASQAVAAFGRVPPDLSLIARARASASGSGADWVYTLLRSYADDPARPGQRRNRWQPNLAMPDPFPPVAGDDTRYDAEMAQVAAFLQWMAEPWRAQRRRLALPVLAVLLVLVGVAYRYRAVTWKQPE